MSVGVDILERQFHSFNIDQAVKECSSREKCAVIIDEYYLNDFMDQCNKLVRASVNQMIIISENLNAVSSLLGGVNVLLISAKSIEEAVEFANFGASFSNDVVYVSNKSENELQHIVELFER